MDVQYPYADGLARQHLLYRLPAVPAPRRMMLVYSERSDKSIAQGWEGPVVALAGAKLKSYAKHNEPSFEAIALPQVLASPPTAAHEMLSAAYRLLTPGGVVVGHVDHLFTMRRLAHPRGLGQWALSAAGRAGIGTPARCLRELARAGFAQPECYFVYPGIESPMSLIPCHQGPARRQFLRAMRRAPNEYSKSGYLLRVLVASIGLGGLQQPQLFFWASKPC